MAKVLIIDGYNIIGAQGRMRNDRDALERERLSLVKSLEVYGSGTAFSEVLLVFDGYPTDRDLSLVRNGLIRILFSVSEGAENADAVIVELARRYRDRAAVVSSDREVVRAVTGSGSESISAQNFLSRLHQRKAGPVAGGRLFPGPEKDDGEEDAPGPSSPVRKKKGNPRRLSKKERAQKRLLDKL